MAGEGSSFPENVTLTYTAVKQMCYPLLRRLLQSDQFHLHANCLPEKTQTNNPVLKNVKQQVQLR